MKYMKKRLYRVREGKIIAGVCGGIAGYFDIDPKIVRILCAAICLVYGSGILAYLLFVIFVRKEPVEL